MFAKHFAKPARKKRFIDIKYYCIVFQSSISYGLSFFFNSVLNIFRGKALGSWHSNKTDQGKGFI